MYNTISDIITSISQGNTLRIYDRTKQANIRFNRCGAIYDVNYETAAAIRDFIDVTVTTWEHVPGYYEITK